jgi:hypothetical protein
VIVSPWRTAVTSFPDAADRTSAASANPVDRYELVRAIQRELRRVGCYEGWIDGSWGVGSKRAVASFMDRVNASLPLRDPDYILLTLIKAQPAAVCGVSCPQGQASASDGRCTPEAILAQAAKKQAPSTPTASADTAVAWTVEVRPSAASAPDLPPPAPLIGRMSVGAPPALPDSVTPRSAAEAVALNGAAGDPDRYGTWGPVGVTRSLDDEGGLFSTLPAGAAPIVESPVPVQSPAAASPRRSSAQRSDRRYRSGSRSVQSLFTHPLGRM